MSNNIRTQIIKSLIAVVGFSTSAHAATTYVVTVTNGSQMPISPAVIYAKAGGESAAKINSAPSEGFVALCQTGNPALRLEELENDSSVNNAFKTMGPVLPGQSAAFEVKVKSPQSQSIHLETMYGKTKDVCGVASVNSHSLVALKQHATYEVIAKDNVLLTGAFLDPEVDSYLKDDVCADQKDAVSCLRSLAQVNMDAKRIRNFSGYLPSVVSAIESKYGAKETQSLIVPTSGAIQVSVKLKH